MNNKNIEIHNKFFRAVERIKIAGIISVKGNNEQIFIMTINELNEILSMSFDLYIKDNLKYNKLFNPEWISIDETQSSDIANIQNTTNFNQFKVENFYDDSSLITKKSHKYGFNSLISAYNDLRKECLKNERTDLAKIINDGFIELLQKITSYGFDDFFMCRYQFEIHQITDTLIYQKIPNEIEPLETVLLRTQGFYGWYLGCFLNERFDFNKFIQIFDDKLFVSIKHLLYKNDFKVFELYTSRLIDGVLIPSLSIEYNFVFKRQWLQDEISHKIDNRIQSTLRGVENIYLLKEKKNRIEMLNSIFIEIESQIESIHKDDCSNFKNYLLSSIREHFCFNHLRINLIHFLAYALSIKKFNFIKNTLNFNQPVGNVSFHMNKDIVPISLYELKEIGLRRYAIDNKFYYLWDNHRDSTPYLKIIYLVLFARVYYYSKTDFNLENNLFNNNSERKSFREFLVLFDDLDFHKILRIEIFPGFTEEFVREFDLALHKLKSDVDKEIQNELLNMEVCPRLILEFKDDVRKALHVNPSLWNIFEKFRAFNNEFDINLKYSYVGIDQIDTKGYFLEDNGNIFVDWPGSYARIISENLEGFLSRELAKNAIRKKCPKYKFIEEIEKIDLKNKIIVASNFRISYDTFKDNNDFKRINVEQMEDFSRTGLVGYYKNEEVYEIFTYSSQWESVLIIDKSDLGMLKVAKPDAKWINQTETINHEYFEVEGFTGNISLIEHIISNDLHWMRDLSKSEKENKLKESVWVRYYKKLAYITPNKSPIIYNF